MRPRVCRSAGPRTPEARSLTSDEVQANFSEIMNGTPSIAARHSHSLAHVHGEEPEGVCPGRRPPPYPRRTRRGGSPAGRF